MSPVSVTEATRAPPAAEKFQVPEQRRLSRPRPPGGTQHHVTTALPGTSLKWAPSTQWGNTTACEVVGRSINVTAQEELPSGSVMPSALWEGRGEAAGVRLTGLIRIPQNPASSEEASPSCPWSHGQRCPFSRMSGLAPRWTLSPKTAFPSWLPFRGKIGLNRPRASQAKAATDKDFHRRFEGEEASAGRGHPCHLQRAYGGVVGGKARSRPPWRNSLSSPARLLI